MLICSVKLRVKIKNTTQKEHSLLMSQRVTSFKIPKKKTAMETKPNHIEQGGLNW